MAQPPTSYATHFPTSWMIDLDTTSKHSQAKLTTPKVNPEQKQSLKFSLDQVASPIWTTTAPVPRQGTPPIRPAESEYAPNYPQTWTLPLECTMITTKETIKACAPDNSSMAPVPPAPDDDAFPLRLALLESMRKPKTWSMKVMDEKGDDDYREKLLAELSRFPEGRFVGLNRSRGPMNAALLSGGQLLNTKTNKTPPKLPEPLFVPDPGQDQPSTKLGLEELKIAGKSERQRHGSHAISNGTGSQASGYGDEPYRTAAASTTYSYGHSSSL
jgi:hypothetical protein